MKSPVKRMQKKYRYQILMRIDGSNEQLRSSIYQIVTSAELVRATAIVEENPSNLS